jgi:ribosome-associated protein
MIPITEKISIPESELKFTATRSGGPGGQNVNKQSTRVTLWFDVAHSENLSPADKDRIFRQLATRVNRRGLLRVVSQKTRSQALNRIIATERFADLLQAVLKPSKSRKPTKIPTSAKQRRLEDKRRRGRLKRFRIRVEKAGILKEAKQRRY